MYSICRKLMGKFQKYNVDDLYLGTILEGNADGEWISRLTALKRLYGVNYLDLCDTYGKNRIVTLYNKIGESEIETAYGKVVVLCKKLIPYNYPLHYVEGLKAMEKYFNEYEVDKQGRVTLTEVYEALEEEKQKVLKK